MNMGFQSIPNLVTCLICNVNNLIQTLKRLNLVLLLKLPTSDTIDFPLQLRPGQRSGRVVGVILSL